MLKSLLLISSLFVSAAASAQSVINDYANERPPEKDKGWSGFFALGSAVLPEYDGSEDYQAIPIAAGQLNKGNYYIASRGLGLLANVVDNRHINAGPVARFRFGRDNDVDNATIARLREVDSAVEVGGFVSHIRRNQFTRGDNLELSFTATQDIAGGHGGLLAELGASYFVAVRHDLRLGLSSSLGYQSTDYMEDYFAIDADNARRSGLTQHETEAGFNNVSIGTQALYSIDQNWGLFALVNYSRWLSDAADSPIVSDKGNANQVFGAVAVTYRF